jgi:hypothetical protein
MTNQEIIDKYLKEFHETQGLTIPIEFHSYLHRMIDQAKGIISKVKPCENGCNSFSTDGMHFKCNNCGTILKQISI